jgi:hypothetical protein
MPGSHPARASLFASFVSDLELLQQPIQRPTSDAQGAGGVDLRALALAADRRSITSPRCPFDGTEAERPALAARLGLVHHLDDGRRDEELAAVLDLQHAGVNERRVRALVIVGDMRHTFLTQDVRRAALVEAAGLFGDDSSDQVCP